MAVELPSNGRLKQPVVPSNHFLRFQHNSAITPRRLRHVSIACIIACVYIAFRQFRFLSYVYQPDKTPFVPQPHAPPSENSSKHIITAEDTVNLWRRVDHDCPPEKSPPVADLYGTGTERVISIGLPDAAAHKPKKGDPASLWQMNSRAMISSTQPMCLYGRSLQNLLSFERRGSSTCQVVAVQQSTLHDARTRGLNESCAAFRTRNVGKMFGREMFYSWDRWQQFISNRSNPGGSRSVSWESDFAIVIPKYEWSYNICHYNRIWNYIIYVIRNLSLFTPEAHQIKHIDVLFRSGYAYNQNWHVGIRNLTLHYLEREVGKTIRVAKLRFNYKQDFQCVKRGLWLGREARVDAFPFFNDTPVWRPEDVVDDNHWPVIPQDALWYRQAVYNSAGLGNYANFSNGVFHSISLPPRRVGFLLRSARSKRRLTLAGSMWLEKTLDELCHKYNMKFEHIRTTAEMSLAQQVQQVQDIGVAVGLHGANLVNSVFMPAGGSLFEIFPWRYVRYYYAGGGNSGLRYSFYEPEGGVDKKCSFEDRTCFMRYRESKIYLSEKDRTVVRSRLEKAMQHVVLLHRRYTDGYIPLRKVGNMYHIDR